MTTDLAGILTALSLVIVAITGLYTAQTARRTARRVEDVHGEVVTGNGQTIGMLADIAEGRAAQAIPVGDRTEQEQHHVNMKVVADRTGAPPDDGSRPVDAEGDPSPVDA